MNHTRRAPNPRRSGALWAVVFVFAVGAIGAALAAALGVHGFGRGMLLGAALACLVLGGVLLGLTVGKSRGRTGADWLPSHDGDA